MALHRQYGHQNGIGSPIGVTTPYYVGQLYFDTDLHTMWRAEGITNTDWAQYGSSANPHSAAEYAMWQIRLAKMRPDLVHQASANFTPTGYDVYPIVGSGWKAGAGGVYSTGPGYEYGGAVLDGTLIDIDTVEGGWLIYTTSTDAFNIADTVQQDPLASYYERMAYIMSNAYLSISATIARDSWNSQLVSPGTNGSLTLSYMYNNIREFNILDSTATYNCYQGSLSTDGNLTTGLNRQVIDFYIPYNFGLTFDVRSGKNPEGGGTYVVKYLDVPSWW